MMKKERPCIGLLIEIISKQRKDLFNLGVILTFKILMVVQFWNGFCYFKVTKVLKFKLSKLIFGIENQSNESITQ